MNTLRSRSITSVFIAIASTALAFIFFSLVPTTAHAAATDNIYGYAWSSNIGWIKMNNCDSPTLCTGAISYGVTMEQGSGERKITGYAWSSNLGWITFNSPATSRCPVTIPASADCQARVTWATTGEALVKGWARACSVFPDGQCGTNGARGVANGGWDGFISLGDSNLSDSASFGVVIDVSSGSMKWFAWGDNVVGWIDFSGVKYDPHTYVCSDGLDNDGDTFIDSADRGCHTDFNASNAATYVPTDPDESDTICPPHTYPDPLGDPAQPKNCYYCPNLAGGPYSAIPAGYQLAPDGISCIKIVVDCAPRESCWCENGSHPNDDQCNQCLPGSVCFCGIRANQNDPSCHTCLRGEVWNPRENKCVCDPNGPAVCGGGGDGDQCKNIPHDIEVELNIGTPPQPPYRKLDDGRCLCVAGYVLNSEYKCVKPTYCELGGNCN